MESGQRIGNYVLVRRLGGGGMGEVWEAVDQVLGRRVAVKCLVEKAAGDPAYLQRFQIEAQSLARLDHPGIVRIYTCLNYENRLHLVMELINGHTLADLLKTTGPRSAPQCMEWFRHIAAALAYSHSNRVFHRDMKPSNIIIDRAGNARLIDFGLARSRDHSFRLTRAGELLGTLPYMAPEQYRGEETDARSDIYSLALTFYNVLTGYVPVRRPDGSHAYVLSKDIPRPFSQILHNCLSPCPNERYPSAEDLLSDLTTAMTGGTPRKIPSRRTKRLKAVALVVGGLGVLVLISALSFIRGRTETSTREPPKSSLTSSGVVAPPSSIRPREAEMIEIPAGDFVSGMTLQDVPEVLRSVPGVENLTQGGHRTLPLGAFKIDKFEVTNADYALFVQATGRPSPDYWNANSPPPGKVRHPVVNVTHADAEAYARWVGKRLPTADEWERAARGTDARIYPWGNEFVPKYCNTSESGLGTTCAVDAFPDDRSPYGVTGMGGNVAEWTSSEQKDVFGNVSYIVCGGSWLESGIIVSLAAFRRNAIGVNVTRPDVGFRCAK